LAALEPRFWAGRFFDSARLVPLLSLKSKPGASA
jgi:hypothetical protein